MNSWKFPKAYYQERQEALDLLSKGPLMSTEQIQVVPVAALLAMSVS